MRPDAPSTIPLICPRCRHQSARGWEMFTLRLERRLRDDARGEVLEGSLACDNAACGARYPIVDGIPIVVADLAAFLRAEAAAVLEGDLAPETAALLASAGPDGEPYPRLLEHLSLYLDAHWGDRATPPPDGPSPAFGLAQLAARLADRAAAPVSRAVELGCSVGRGLAELARGAQLVVGVDLHFGALRRARRLLAGDPVEYARRVVGREYVTARASAGDRRAPSAILICGDALDPPLAPGGFDRVSALNLLDSVRTPATLLSVVDKLCAPGGELLLACPFAWHTGIVDEDARFGGADPASELVARLAGGYTLDHRYAIEESLDVPWSLRRDSRSAHLYATRWVRARQLPSL